MLFTNRTTSLKLSRIKWSSVTISKMVAAIALLVGMCLSRRAAQLRRHLRKRSAKVEALSHSHHSVSLEFSLIWFSGGREQHLHDAERKHKNWVKSKEKRRAEKWRWEKVENKKRGRERDEVQEEQSIKDIKRQVYTLWEWGGGRVSQLRLLTTWCEGSSECANIQPLNDVKLSWWLALNAFAVFLFQVIRKGVAVDFPAVNGGIPICKDFLKVPKSRAPKFTCEV